MGTKRITIPAEKRTARALKQRRGVKKPAFIFMMRHSTKRAIKLLAAELAAKKSAELGEQVTVSDSYVAESIILGDKRIKRLLPLAEEQLKQEKEQHATKEGNRTDED